VNALTLAETRLMVTADCIDCGNCVLARPVGALQPEDAKHTLQPSRHLAQREYDLVVVGAGPGGATAAHRAAQAGLSILLLEKRQEIGSPVRCAEGVGHDQLTSFIEPDPRWISAEVSQTEITCVADGAQQTLRMTGRRGYVLERRIFDRALAERAAQASAQVRVKTAVTGLLIEDGHVCGVGIERGDFYTGPGEAQVRAKIVIAADSVESQVGCWANLEVQLPLEDMMVCA